MQQNLTFYFSMFLNLFVHVEVPMFVCSFANILSQLDLILYFIYSYSLINSTQSSNGVARMINNHSKLLAD